MTDYFGAYAFNISKARQRVLDAEIIKTETVRAINLVNNIISLESGRGNSYAYVETFKNDEPEFSEDCIDNLVELYRDSGYNVNRCNRSILIDWGEE